MVDSTLLKWLLVPVKGLSVGLQSRFLISLNPSRINGEMAQLSRDEWNKTQIVTGWFGDRCSHSFCVFVSFFFFSDLRLSKPSRVGCVSLHSCLPTSQWGRTLADFRWCFIMEIVSTSGFRVDTRTHSHSTQQQNRTSLHPSTKEQSKKNPRKAEGHTGRREVKVIIKDWDTDQVVHAEKNMMRHERLLMCEKHR